MSGENDGQFTGAQIVGKRYIVGADGVMREVPTLLTPADDPQFPFTIVTTDWRVEALEADNRRLEAELKATKLIQELDALRKLDVAVRQLILDNGSYVSREVLEAVGAVNEARGTR